MSFYKIKNWLIMPIFPFDSTALETLALKLTDRHPKPYIEGPRLKNYEFIITVLGTG